MSAHQTPYLLAAREAAPKPDPDAESRHQPRMPYTAENHALIRTGASTLSTLHRQIVEGETELANATSTDVKARIEAALANVYGEMRAILLHTDVGGYLHGLLDAIAGGATAGDEAAKLLPAFIAWLKEIPGLKVADGMGLAEVITAIRAELLRLSAVEAAAKTFAEAWAAEDGSDAKAQAFDDAVTALLDALGIVPSEPPSPPAPTPSPAPPTGS